MKGFFKLLGIALLVLGVSVLLFRLEFKGLQDDIEDLKQRMNRRMEAGGGAGA